MLDNSVVGLTCLPSINKVYRIVSYRIVSFGKAITFGNYLSELSENQRYFRLGEGATFGTLR